MIERYLLPAIFIFVGWFTWLIFIGSFFGVGLIFNKDFFETLFLSTSGAMLMFTTFLASGPLFVWFYVAKRARYRFAFHSLAIIEFSFYGGIILGQLIFGDQVISIMSIALGAVLLSWGFYYKIK